jgi:hypothetical protein
MSCFLTWSQTKRHPGAIGTGIIQVGPVKGQQIARFEAQVMDGLEIRGLAVADCDALRQQPGEHGMQFNGPFAGPKLGPGKDRSAQVDGGGIDDFDLRGLLGLWRQRSGDPLIQLIVGLLEDNGRALLIRVGQGGTLHRGQTQMVELAGLPVEAEHQVPETLAGGPLAEEHGRQVRPISEFPDLRPLPGMGVHQVVENMSRYEL